MKKRINSRINNHRSNIKTAKNHRVKMQHNSVCQREDACGYCLAHTMYLNWNYIGNVKKGRCIDCPKFIRITNKKGEKIL